MKGTHPRRGAQMERIEMSRDWWCQDCSTTVVLDTHGRCSNCGSSAVHVAIPETQPGWRDVSIRVSIVRKESK